MRTILPIAIAVVLTLLPVPTWADEHAARSCIGGLSYDDYLAVSAAVFVGRAVGQVVLAGPGGAETETTFEVEQQWKGERHPTTTVRTCGGDGSTVCSTAFHFVTGRRYLVFAWGAPLRTSACSLTATVQQAEPVLDWLRQRGR